MRLLYGHESWWDERRANHFARRIGNRDVTIIECLVEPALNVQAWKESLRHQFCVPKISSLTGHIHFPDSDLEVGWIIRVLDHKDSLTWMEHGPDIVPRNLRLALREWAIELRNYPRPENLALTMGTVLRIQGVVRRQVSDIDFVASDRLLRKIPNTSFDLHVGKEWRLTDDELEFGFLFAYKYFQMVNLRTLARQKYRRYIYRGLRKDYSDLIRILGVTNPVGSVNAMNRLSLTVKRMSDEIVFSLAMALQTRRRRFHLDP